MDVLLQRKSAFFKAGSPELMDDDAFATNKSVEEFVKRFVSDVKGHWKGAKSMVHRTLQNHGEFF